MAETTRTLKWQVDYIEGHAPGVTLTTCKMYRRRHIFESDDGTQYVLRTVAGFDEFGSTLEAIDAINADPEIYLISR